jgi:hypothetical protein
VAALQVRIQTSLLKNDKWGHTPKKSLWILAFYPTMLIFSSMHLVCIEHVAELDVSGGEKYVF